MNWVLWGRQADAIIDIKLSDSDAYYYIFEAMTALLAWWEKINKYKNSKNYHEQPKHFSLFVISLNLMLGRKALVLSANLR